MELNDFRVLIDAALDDALGEALTRLVATAPELTRPGELLRRASVGGKRIRPMLVLIGHRLVEGHQGDALGPAIGPALATEFLHLCALLHDDVIDAARVRRGQPAFHVAAAQDHRDAHWRGDADGHGRAAAILFGDLAFVLADDAFFRSDAAADRLVAAHRVFTVMREEVMRGQYLDVEAAARGGVSVDQALAIARDKSGRYTITRPTEIGAVLAGATPPIVAALHEWGDPLGLAFQLTDDLLGVLGDPDVTGKDVTSDLREGKRTVLVAEALSALGPADAERLDALLGRSGLDDAELAWMRQSIIDSGAADAVRRRVQDLVDESRAALSALVARGVDDDAARLLGDVARTIARREL